MTIPLRFNCHLLRSHRYHHRHITMLTTTTTTMMMTAMMLVVVLGDYPYSNSGNNRGHGAGGGDGYLSDWSSEWDNLGNPNPGKCIDIPSDLPLCANIGYTQMRLPNLLEHDTLKEVSQQASSWVRLHGLRCHPDTQIFLCSLFAPVCLERPIWPCRSLCESVQAGCESRMLTYGFPWPEMLRCGRFPADDDLCIGMRNDSQKGSESPCSACLSDTFESAVDHYCRAEFVMRVKVKQAIVVGTDMKIDTEKKKKVFKTRPQLSNERLDSSLFLVQGSSCECSAIDGAGAGAGKNDSHFIVMGSAAAGGGGGDRLVLSFVHRLDHRASKNVSRALRVARTTDICTKGASDVLKAGSSSSSSSSSEGKKGGGGGGGNKSGKKKAKGKATTPTGKEGRIKKASAPTTTTTPAGRKSTATPKGRAAAAAATTAASRRRTHQSGKTADGKQPQQQQQKKKKAATADPRRFY